MPYASGRVKATIVSPVEPRTSGDRVLVSDPAVRSELALLSAQLKEVLEHLKEDTG